MRPSYRKILAINVITLWTMITYLRYHKSGNCVNTIGDHIHLLSLTTPFVLFGSPYRQVNNVIVHPTAAAAHLQGICLQNSVECRWWNCTDVACCCSASTQASIFYIHTHTCLALHAIWAYGCRKTEKSSKPDENTVLHTSGTSFIWGKQSLIVTYDFKFKRTVTRQMSVIWASGKFITRKSFHINL